MKKQRLYVGKILGLSPKICSLLIASFLCGNNVLAENSQNHAQIKVEQNQTTTVKGKILDEEGMSIIGANILVKGTTNGTITDFDGNFQLNVSYPCTLTVSYIGYISKEITIKSPKDFYEIILKQDNKTLDEVVVVGYSVQKKVNLTGSVAAISAKKLESRPVTNTSTALQGLLPGVTSIQRSGQPGRDNSSISVRGVGTLNNSNPMYIVDGLPVSTINDIDPNDIANLSVLKDAASAAIYGSRAANGVILITTKKGSNKAPTLKYSGYVGLQSPTDLPDYLSSYEYGKLYNQALINEGNEPAYTPEELQKFKDGSDPDNYPNTDWLGLLYKDASFQQSHRAEVSGGSKHTTYMMSLGYLQQNGIIKHSDFRRYNARANVSTQIKKLNLGMNLSYVFGDINEPSNPYTGDMYQIFRQINRIAPFVPNKYSNGYYGHIADGNPIQWIENGSKRNEKYHTVRGVGNASFEIIEGLVIKEVLGYEYTGRSDEKYIVDSQFYNWKTGEEVLHQGPNYQKDKRQEEMRVNLQTLLTYNKTFGKHTLGALAGYSQEYYRLDWTSGYRKDFLGNNLHELNAGSAAGQLAEGAANEYALQSFFGRLTYSYNDRYLLEANIRHDGTSRIYEDNRWGTFPSFSAAWRINNEEFFQPYANTISNLKLRAGWGMLGNQNIGYYPYQPVYSSMNYSFGGKVATGVGPKDASNKDLKWETTTSTNIGVDLGLYNNKITLSADAYWKKTSDILMQIPISSIAGVKEPYQNVGEVINRGYELQVGYKDNFGDFRFDASANISYNHNEILNLNNNGAKIWNGNKYSFLQEGLPVNAFGGYECLGIFTSQEDLDNSAVIDEVKTSLGDLKYKDQNNDGKITAEDRVYLGSFSPKVLLGLNLNFGWKGFDLGLQFSGATNVKGYLSNETVGRLNGDTSKPTSVFLDSWDAKTNPNGKFPRPLSSWLINDSENVPSSFWIIDSSYLRLKNVQFGYAIPKNICEKISIQNARIYYSGQNLLTFSKFTKGYDPEAPVGARGYYPQVKTHTIGLNVTF